MAGAAPEPDQDLLIGGWLGEFGFFFYNWNLNFGQDLWQESRRCTSSGDGLSNSDVGFLMLDF